MTGRVNPLCQISLSCVFFYKIGSESACLYQTGYVHAYAASDGERRFFEQVKAHVRGSRKREEVAPFLSLC